LIDELNSCKVPFLASFAGKCLAIIPAKCTFRYGLLENLHWLFPASCHFLRDLEENHLAIIPAKCHFLHHLQENVWQ